MGRRNRSFADERSQTGVWERGDARTPDAREGVVRRAVTPLTPLTPFLPLSPLYTAQERARRFREVPSAGLIRARPQGATAAGPAAPPAWAGRSGSGAVRCRRVTAPRSRRGSPA